MHAPTKSGHYTAVLTSAPSAQASIARCSGQRSNPSAISASAPPARKVMQRPRRRRTQSARARAETSRRPGKCARARGRRQCHATGGEAWVEELLVR
eukprot:7240586-Pyramimonas_sp.AAC.1